MPEEIRSVNLDAGETQYFARELEHVKAKTYDKRYPEFRAIMLIPVSTEAGPAATSITYEQYDQVGMAKIIANYADDLPRADIKGKEFTSPIRSMGNAYGYSVQDIRSSRATGKPLEVRKANSARRAHDQLTNDIAWKGDAEHGLPGLLSNANIPVLAATGAWSGLTAAQILGDLNAAVNKIIKDTKGVEVPDTIVLPIDQYTLISTTNMGLNNDTTILEYFLRNQPMINAVEWANELDGAGTAGADVMVVYRKDPDKLTLELPQPFEQFPAQEKGLSFEVPCHSRIGGVIVYYPLSLLIVEGI